MSTPLVGIIELPHLAAVLSARGFEVITAEGAYMAQAQEVHKHLAAGAFPIIAADTMVRGTESWLRKTAAQYPFAAVSVDQDADQARVPDLDAPTFVRHAAPVRLDHLLRSVGLPSGGDLDSLLLTPSGEIVPAAAPPAPAPQAYGIAPTTQAPAPQPLAPQQAPAPVPLPYQGPTAGYDAPMSYDPGAYRPASPPLPTPAVVPVPPATAERRGQVALVWAAKGGVGKSTSAMAIAQAAAGRGMKVVLVDGNRGQGDVREFLSIAAAALPTIYDVATGSQPADVIITPEQLAANRPGMPRLGFAVVQAPPRGLADPRVVTTEVYAATIEHLRRVADLVVIDTQIAEDFDTSDLWDSLWIPLAGAHAWTLGITDLSVTGITNIIHHARRMHDLGVPIERAATILNRVPAEITYNESNVAAELKKYGHYLGRAAADHVITGVMTRGALPPADSELARHIDSFLLRVTGNTDFAPGPELVAAGSGGRQPFWKRRR